MEKQNSEEKMFVTQSKRWHCQWARRKNILDVVILPDNYKKGSENKAVWVEETKQEKTGKKENIIGERNRYPQWGHILEVPHSNKWRALWPRCYSSLSPAFRRINRFTISKSVGMKPLLRKGTGSTWTGVSFLSWRIPHLYQWCVFYKRFPSKHSYKQSFFWHRICGIL